MADAPRTPSWTPELVTSVATGAVAVTAQLVSIPADAQESIAQLATTLIVATTASGTAVRLGRQKWWRNFMVDHDGNPATPPRPASWLVPAFAAAVFVAVALAVALVVVAVG